MTVNIDVGTVLRGTVCDLYSNLVTRPTGAAVRTAIEEQVLELGASVVTTIDFSQVNLLDFSCADEIVAKLLLRYASDDGLPGFLTFRGIHEGHIDPIETVLERHALALVSWHEGAAELFGHVDDDERSHWEAVRDHGPIWAEALAPILAVSEAFAAQQLDRLRVRRLIMRRDDGFTVPGTVARAS
ncbi:hypothetical protein [Gemmatimonas groenlandica]|uniref:STAS domain-containing protein n=1 Tax=Gemmatimonas groenlandica TaxID=2732249 RepID=A0A6M4IQS7_9BACT|nr:hypothetical protein [Gemmatimonas groenlandica]QJR34611.1 hypothetical protein HKW67_03300 [Gemmatimonas groenlandica]